MIRFNRYAAALGIMLAAMSISIDAQWVRYPTADVPRGRDGKPNLAAPAPRLPNGKPDLSGVWSNDGYGAPGQEGTGPTPRTVFFDISHGMKGVTPPFQPWAAELYTKRKDELAKDNPDARCLPIGALQMLAHPLPKKILHTPRLLVILHERNMEFRQIFLDGRPLPDDPTPTPNGYSIGRWDGDTLVVQTVGFRDGTWLDRNGSPMTAAAKITERYRRVSFGHLQVEVTVDDPQAYTKPWTVTLDELYMPDTELLDYHCTDFAE
jgi:hypothetical protein